MLRVLGFALWEPELETETSVEAVERGLHGTNESKRCEKRGEVWLGAWSTLEWQCSAVHCVFLA